MTTRVPARLYQQIMRAEALGLDVDAIISGDTTTGPSRKRSEAPQVPPYEPPTIEGLWRADKVTKRHTGAYGARTRRRDRVAARTSIELIVDYVRANPDMHEVRPPKDDDPRPDFTACVVDLFLLHDWFVEHSRPATNVDGKTVTHLSGDNGGPDIKAAGHGRILWVELKTSKSYLEGPQKLWRERIPPDVYRLWRPTDIDEIVAELADIYGEGVIPST